VTTLLAFDTGTAAASAEPVAANDAALAPAPPAVAAENMFVRVYVQLKSMARRELGRGDGHTLHTTALVHELYLRLCDGRELEFAGPGQFFVYAARAMRHILLDRAYKRLRLKAGGDAAHVDLSDPAVDHVAIDAGVALQLDAALTALEATDARAARVVELHYFAGLDLDQVAGIVGVSRRTIDREWRYARAFLLAHVH
jgi:RNA polymerase sigma factor (TIGR02999 family)